MGLPHRGPRRERRGQVTASGMHRHLVAWLAIAGALMAAATGAGAADGPPTVAVIAGRALDLREAPVVALLEAELSRKEGIRLLERMEVEKLLEEQRLELALSPEGGHERVALGRLLKADVLMLLCARDEGTRHIEIVVCETARGLRLLVGKARWGGDPKADAAALAKLLDSALGKYREDVTEICAVPPFVSRDLTHKHDHLQGAYAKLIEQTLLRRRGMLVVELAEARAIARELGLAGHTLEVRRKLPLYFVGEYRSEGVKDGRRLSVSLALRRGEKELAAESRRRMLPDEAAPFLLLATNKLLARVAGEEGPPPDAETEARQLAERAEEFASLGFWREAADLLEASVLLDPQTIEPRSRMLLALRMLAKEYYDYSADADAFARKGRLILDCYRQGLPHARFLLDSVTKDDVQIVKGISRFLSCCSLVRIHKRCGADLAAMSRELEMERREILLTFLESLPRRRMLTNWIVNATEMGGPLRFRRSEEALAENLKARLRAMRAIRGLPLSTRQSRILYWAGVGIAKGPEEQLLYDRFVDQIVEAEGRGPAKRLVDRIERRKASARRPRPRPAKTPDKAPKELPKVGLHPLRFSWEDESGRQLPSERRFRGLLPCGEGVDVVWGGQSIYIMKKKGTLRRAYRWPERLGVFEGVCYDGRYVWAPVKTRSKPLVVAIDPESGRVYRFTSEDGLPGTSFGVVAAPLSPGRICVSGSFGKEGVTNLFDRGWCAILELGAAGGRSVDVILEATVQSDGVSREEYKNPNLAFRPRYIFALGDGRSKEQRVLLARSTRGTGNSGHYVSPGSHPLIIDPEKRSVSVVMDSLSLTSNSEFAPITDGDKKRQGHSVHWIMGSEWPACNGTHWRAGPPDFRKTLVAEGFPVGHLVFYNNAVYVIGRRWWTADSPVGKFQELKADMPARQALLMAGSSNHYGLVLVFGSAGVIKVVLP